MNTKELAEYVMIINNYTDYEAIEIEQVSKKVNPRSVNSLEGALMLRYKKIMDDSDPENPTIQELKGEKLDGGTMTFVNNPYPNLRRPVGSGKVTYLVDDKLPPKKEDFPNGYLSGAKTGYNLEFLASHYAENLWVIIDPKWDKIVRERHEKMLEAKAEIVHNHVFDGKYRVKGIGTAPAPFSQVSVVPDPALVETMKEMQTELADNRKKIAELTEKKAKKNGKNGVFGKKSQEEKTDSEPVNTFAK
ncbi:MAG: hypothetical protein GY861_12535 [bacterium]|nr:hypothetical protein [bacterium]